MISDKFVCDDCIDEEGLKKYIRLNSMSKECNYCGRTSDQDIAINLEDLTEFILERLNLEYDDAANCLPYETAEGGFQGTYWDTYDLLFEELCLELPNDANGTLRDDLTSAVGEKDWCERDPFGPDETMRAQISWDHFSNIVKHTRRFFFHDAVGEERSEALPPSVMLSLIYEYGLEVGFSVTVKKGTRFFRVRGTAPEEVLSGPDMLGPPEKSQALTEGRMNPAGVVVLYVSSSLETAIAETSKRKDKPNRFFGVFEAKRDLNLFDLTRLPNLPSLFEPSTDTLSLFKSLPVDSPIQPRNVILFLRALTREISKPIIPDDRVHLEYIPTQVVAEFIRHTANKGGQLDGIAYRSAADHDGISFVLFSERYNIEGATEGGRSFDDGDIWLKLVDQGKLT